MFTKNQQVVNNSHLKSHFLFNSTEPIIWWLILILVIHKLTILLMFRESTNLTHVSSERLFTATGKNWTQWLSLLDNELAFQKSITEIKSIISNYFEGDLTILNFILQNYMHEKGILDRLPKQGDLEITSTLTIESPLHVTESAFTDVSLRNAWLPEVDSILKLNPGKNLRFAWQNAQVVVVTFNPKGPGKCQVSLQHSKLPDMISSVEMKSFWKEKLSSLARLLESK